MDLDGCGPAEMERIARDVGVSGADLSILAGKWPDAADQLYWRMSEIKLDRKEVTHADPQVMRDLQRVCTVCRSKRRCEHELAKNPSDPAWEKYCPNATTLSAWRLSELPELRQVRWYEKSSRQSQSSSSGWVQLCYAQGIPPSHNHRRNGEV